MEQQDADAVLQHREGNIGGRGISVGERATLPKHHPAIGHQLGADQAQLVVGSPLPLLQQSAAQQSSGQDDVTN